MTNIALHSIDLFNGCQKDFFSQLQSGMQAHVYDKGKVLFIHGEPADHFYYINSGWVKLFRETLDGSQAIIDILPQGHVFGETSVLDDGLYAYSAEVVEPAEIVSFPTSILKTQIANDHHLALNMMKSMVKYRAHQSREIEHRSVQNAAQRIGCFILRLVEQAKPNNIEVHLPYDKALVAGRLGMQPETFSRGLSKLKNETGIEVKGSTVRMDSLDQLVKYCCAACSSEFPCK